MAEPGKTEFPQSFPDSKKSDLSETSGQEPAMAQRLEKLSDDLRKFRENSPKGAPIIVSQSKEKSTQDQDTPQKKPKLKLLRKR